MLDSVRRRTCFSRWSASRYVVRVQRGGEKVSFGNEGRRFLYMAPIPLPCSRPGGLLRRARSQETETRPKTGNTSYEYGYRGGEGEGALSCDDGGESWEESWRRSWFFGIGCFGRAIARRDTSGTARHYLLARTARLGTRCVAAPQSTAYFPPSTPSPSVPRLCRMY